MTQGTLFVVATPIGNLEDITFRAIRTLQEVDYVYCEDTRQTRKLLNHYQITTQTRTLHAHSSDKAIQAIINELNNGKSIAYVTDSGTPGVSDPGSKLIHYAAENNIVYSPIPGPSALAALISVSGSKHKEIVFSGFLSKKDGKQKRELTTLKEFPGTIVIYESPYRIHKTLKRIVAIFPDAKLAIGRELTKKFEEIITLHCKDADDAIIEAIKAKGEFAIAIIQE